MTLYPGQGGGVPASLDPASIVARASQDPEARRLLTYLVAARLVDAYVRVGRLRDALAVAERARELVPDLFPGEVVDKLRALVDADDAFRLVAAAAKAAAGGDLEAAERYARAALEKAREALRLGVPQAVEQELDRAIRNAQAVLDYVDIARASREIREYIKEANDELSKLSSIVKGRGVGAGVDVLEAVSEDLSRAIALLRDLESRMRLPEDREAVARSRRALETLLNVVNESMHIYQGIRVFEEALRDIAERISNPYDAENRLAYAVDYLLTRVEYTWNHLSRPIQAPPGASEWEAAVYKAAEALRTAALDLAAAATRMLLEFYDRHRDNPVVVYGVLRGARGHELYSMLPKPNVIAAKYLDLMEFLAAMRAKARQWYEEAANASGLFDAAAKFAAAVATYLSQMIIGIGPGLVTLPYYLAKNLSKVIEGLLRRDLNLVKKYAIDTVEMFFPPPENVAEAIAMVITMLVFEAASRAKVSEKIPVIRDIAKAMEEGRFKRPLKVMVPREELPGIVRGILSLAGRAGELSGLLGELAEKVAKKYGIEGAEARRLAARILQRLSEEARMAGDVKELAERIAKEVGPFKASPTAEALEKMSRALADAITIGVNARPALDLLARVRSSTLRAALSSVRSFARELEATVERLGAVVSDIEEARWIVEQYLGKRYARQLDRVIQGLEESRLRLNALRNMIEGIKRVVEENKGSIASLSEELRRLGDELGVDVGRILDENPGAEGIAKALEVLVRRVTEDGAALAIALEPLVKTLGRAYELLTVLARKLRPLGLEVDVSTIVRASEELASKLTSMVVEMPEWLAERLGLETNKVTLGKLLEVTEKLTLKEAVDPNALAELAKVLTPVREVLGRIRAEASAIGGRFYEAVKDLLDRVSDVLKTLEDARKAAKTLGEELLGLKLVIESLPLPKDLIEKYVKPIDEAMKADDPRRMAEALARVAEELGSGDLASEVSKALSSVKDLGDLAAKLGEVAYKLETLSKRLQGTAAKLREARGIIERYLGEDYARMLDERLSAAEKTAGSLSEVARMLSDVAGVIDRYKGNLEALARELAETAKKYKIVIGHLLEEPSVENIVKAVRALVETALGSPETRALSVIADLAKVLVDTANALYSLGEALKRFGIKLDLGDLLKASEELAAKLEEATVRVPREVAERLGLGEGVVTLKRLLEAVEKLELEPRVLDPGFYDELIKALRLARQELLEIYGEARGGLLERVADAASEAAKKLGAEIQAVGEIRDAVKIFRDVVDETIDLIKRSDLPEKLKNKYTKLLRDALEKGDLGELEKAFEKVADGLDPGTLGRLKMLLSKAVERIRHPRLKETLSRALVAVSGALKGLREAARRLASRVRGLDWRMLLDPRRLYNWLKARVEALMTSDRLSDAGRLLAELEKAAREAAERGGLDKTLAEMLYRELRRLERELSANPKGRAVLDLKAGFLRGVAGVATPDDLAAAISKYLGSSRTMVLEMNGKRYVVERRLVYRPGETELVYVAGVMEKPGVYRDYVMLRLRFGSVEAGEAGLPLIRYVADVVVDPELAATLEEARPGTPRYQEAVDVFEALARAVNDDAARLGGVEVYLEPGSEPVPAGSLLGALLGAALSGLARSFNTKLPIHIEIWEGGGRGAAVPLPEPRVDVEVGPPTLQVPSAPGLPPGGPAINLSPDEWRIIIDIKETLDRALTVVPMIRSLVTPLVKTRLKLGTATIRLELPKPRVSQETARYYTARSQATEAEWTLPVTASAEQVSTVARLAYAAPNPPPGGGEEEEGGRGRPGLPPVFPPVPVLGGRVSLAAVPGRTVAELLRV